MMNRISYATAFLASLLMACTSFAQYSPAATRAYCDRNRELAAAEAVQQLGPQIQPAVSQEVQRIAQDIATNLYPIVVVETNLNIVATQIVDNVISNYTIVSNVLVYSQNTYVTNNIYAQTNIAMNVDVMTNTYYVSNYTNIYNNTITNNIFALTNIETTVSNTYYVSNYTDVYVNVFNNYTTNHIFEIRDATDVFASNRIVNGNYDFNDAQQRFGKWSVASGNGSAPTGEGAHAEGYQTTAGGAYSFAAGRMTSAAGPYSIAVGDNTTASESYAFSSGRKSIAGGFLSEAHGDSAYATNSRSYVWSGLTNGVGSHGNGTFTINPAGGPSGFYIDGYNLPEIISNIAPREADVSLIGNELNIQGSKTNIVTIQANNGITIGEQTTASGANSLAAGWQTEASGIASFSAGRMSRSFGNYSVAIGNNTIASNTYSIAEGNGSIAIGAQSKASGFMATTQHRNSYVWNGDTSVSNYQSHGIGTFNLNPEGGANSFYIGDSSLYDIVDSRMSGVIRNIDGTVTIPNKLYVGGGMELGYHANLGGTGLMAVGWASHAYGWLSISLGTYAEATAQNSIAIGGMARALHDNSVVISANYQSISQNNNSIGDGTISLYAKKDVVGSDTQSWTNSALSNVYINGIKLKDLIKHVIDHPNE